MDLGIEDPKTYLLRLLPSPSRAPPPQPPPDDPRVLAALPGRRGVEAPTRPVPTSGERVVRLPVGEAVRLGEVARLEFRGSMYHGVREASSSNRFRSCYKGDQVRGLGAGSQWTMGGREPKKAGGPFRGHRLTGQLPARTTVTVPACCVR